MLIVDTGVLVAAADRSDPQHSRCAPLVAGASGQMRTTAMVIAEAAYLIERELGPRIERLLYDSIIAGELIVEHLTIDDWKRTAELVTRYASLPLGGTDASLMALAERHERTEIATLDHRHFTVVRPDHVDAFTLLP
ncbi:type II toxin-antitoxin system VapC family toxin [Ilumatobacter sp.]|uniref:type II toxin-antitoxin system VapC family toxin n=1 Tax=Ilumatobacter sp. TaxID=1967498 RepID=UPI003751A958